MKNRKPAITFLISGIALAGFGLYFLKSGNQVPVFIKVIQSLMTGAGCILFGYGSSKLLEINALKNSPELEKDLEIQNKDERNTMLRDKSKAKAFDLMLHTFNALILAFLVMKVELSVFFTFISAYIFIVLSWLFFFNRYSKEF